MQFGSLKRLHRDVRSLAVGRDGERLGFSVGVDDDGLSVHLVLDEENVVSLIGDEGGCAVT